MKSHVKFTLFALLCNACIMALYSVARPVSNSLFITAYGPGAFPYVWLATLPASFALVAAYQKLLEKWGPKGVFLVLIGAVVGMDLLAATFLGTFSWFPFVYYLWKEIYIMLLFQCLWPIIHSNVNFSTAKYLYGIFYGIGGFAAFLGSQIPSFLATKLGSQNLLYFTPLISGAMCLMFLLMYRESRGAVEEKLHRKEKVKVPLREGMSLVFKRPVLLYILMAVVLMQVCSSNIDYLFHSELSTAYPEQDARTAYCGKVFGIMSGVTSILQFFGTFLLIRLLGLQGVHMLVPMLLFTIVGTTLVYPSFAVLSLALISIKSLDFSLFGIVKEMLYIPMEQKEKFQAKSIIDVFAYRSAKTLASCIILAIQWSQLATSKQLISWATALLLCLWIFGARKLLPKKSEREALTT